MREHFGKGGEPVTTLSQAMRLYDGVTPVLRNIQQAMHMTLNAFDQMQEASSQPINQQDLQAARAQINEVGTAIRAAEEEQQRLNQQMRQCGSGLENTNRNIDRMNQSINKATGSTDGLIGEIRQLAAVSTITIMVKLSFNTFVNFEQEMAKVRAISGATAGEYRLLEDSARALGRATTFSATEAAEGMKYLSMAGWETNQIVAAMPGMLNLAAAGAVELGETADIVSDTMTGFGLSASEAMHAADVFAETVTSTNTDVTMMGEAMKYISPIAKQFGADIEQTSAMIGLMANAGIKASQAGTSLRSGLLRLADPRARAEMQLEKLGLSFVDAAGKMKDIQQIVSEVSAAFMTLSESERLAAGQRIFGVEAVSGWLAMLDQGAEALDDMVEQLRNSDGASQAMADIMNDTILGNMKLMASYAQDAMIEVGMAIRDGLEAQGVGETIMTTFQKSVDFSKSMMLSLLPAIVQLGVAFQQLVPVVVLIFSIVGAMAQGAGTALGFIGGLFNHILLPLIPLLAGLATGFIAYKAAVLGIAFAKGIAGAATATWTTATGIATMITHEYTAATTGATLAQLRLNMALLANPIGLVVGLIAVLVGVLAYFMMTNDKVAKGILAAWYAMLNGFDQIGLGISNIFYRICNTVNHFILTTLDGIEGLINGAIAGLNKFSGAVKDVTGIGFGTIKDIDITSRFRSAVQVSNQEHFQKYSQKQQDVMTRASERQAKLDSFASGKQGFLEDTQLTSTLAALEGYDQNDTLRNVDHVNSVGSINDDVNISDENLKLMEELITQKYVNQVNLQMAAPQITVAPTVEVTKEADADAMIDYINDHLTEQAISSAEQSYVKEIG